MVWRRVSGRVCRASSSSCRTRLPGMGGWEAEHSRFLFVVDYAFNCSGVVFRHIKKQKNKKNNKKAAPKAPPPKKNQTNRQNWDLEINNTLLCPYRAVVDQFLVDQYLHVSMKGSIGGRRLWVRLYFSPICPLYRVRLIWIVSEMGGWWSYSFCFVKFCFHDLFRIPRSSLVQFPSSFFTIRLVSVHIVQSYSRVDKTANWKKLRQILLGKSITYHEQPMLSIIVYWCHFH